MRITQLRQIVAVAQYGSINKAAQELNISQPALSAALRELENELGLSLFQRTQRGVAPTTEGAKIIEEAKQVLTHIERINHVAEVSDVRSEIQIATGAFFNFMIPDIITAYQQENPNILLRFFQLENLNNIMNSISKDHYRISLCCFSPGELEQLHEIKRLTAYILFPYIEISVILHKHHPFAQKKFITPKELITEKLIMVDSALTNYHFEQVPILREACKAIVPDTNTALMLAQNNVGITIQNISICNKQFYEQQFPDLVFVPYHTEMKNIFSAAIIAPKKSLLSKTEASFIDIVKQISRKYTSKL